MDGAGSHEAAADETEKNQRAHDVFASAYSVNEPGRGRHRAGREGQEDGTTRVREQR